MKIGYIINPVAGRKQAGKLAPLIKKATYDKGFEAAIYITGCPEDVVEKSEKAVREGCHLVVAVGGDGTISEVVNGIRQSNVVMGVIPAGSGNDFARSLSIPMDFKGALDCVFKGRTRRVDIGTVNGYFFSNVASVGFDAQVVMETENIKKYIRGPLAYPLGVIKALIRYKPFDIELETEDRKIKKQAVLVAVANGMYYGGGMKIAPGAVLDDGLFDVCLVEDMSKLKIMRLFPLIYSGRHLMRPETEYFRAREVRIKCQNGHINTDGGIIGRCPADLSMQPQCMSIIVP